MNLEVDSVRLARRWHWTPLAEVGAIAAIFLAAPHILGLDRSTDFIIFCIFVMGFNLLYGFMGRLSFGHMLYYGSGAYGVTLFAQYVSPNPLLAVLAGIAGGALVAAVLGPVIVRTTGACFALINLAFNQIGYFFILVALSRYTGGEDGLSASFAHLGPLDFGRKPVIFGFSLICLLLTYYLLRKLTTSPFGLLVKSIKENEVRVKFLGYSTFRYKWATFVLSAAVSAFAGALAILNYSYVTPSFIDPNRNVEVIFATLIGGPGSLFGALTGGVLYMGISNYLASYIPHWEMFLGIALLVVVFRFRKGVWGFFADRSGTSAGRT